MMDKDYGQWLKEMEADSRAKQEQFMNRIAGRLKRPRLQEAPPRAFRGAPDYWREFAWSPEEKLNRFAENFTSAGGHVVRLADMEAAKTFMLGKAEEMKARYILRQNDPALAEPGWKRRSPLPAPGCRCGTPTPKSRGSPAPRRRTSAS